VTRTLRAKHRSIKPNQAAAVKFKVRSKWSISESGDELLHHPVQAAMSGRTDARRLAERLRKRGHHGLEEGISGGESNGIRPQGRPPRLIL
jgi:hypothetical protein